MSDNRLEWQQLKHLSIQDFFNAIPYSFINKIGYVLLMTLAIFPLLGLFFRVFETVTFDTDFAFKIYLQIIGYQCLLFGTFASIWKFYNKNLNKLSSKNIINYGLIIGLLMMFIWSLFSAILSDNWSIAFLGTYYRQDGFLMYVAYAGIFYMAISITDYKIGRASCRVRVYVRV